jgi:hypothetical protein
MIYWLYAHLLKRQITELPGHVCFMIDAKDMADAPENLYHVTSWCNDISAYAAKYHPSKPAGIQGLTFHISTLSPGEPDAFLPAIRKISTIARLNLHYGDHEEMTLLALVAIFGTTVFSTIMTPAQLIVFALVTMLYVPCISTIMALAQEFGWKKALGITLLETALAIFTGAVAIRLLGLFL